MLNRDARVALVLLVPLLVGVAFSFTRLALAGSHVPDDADYVAARRALDEAGFDRRADALAILPPWSLRPLQVMGDLDPISGDHLSARPLHRHRRLFVLVEPDPSDEHEALIERLGPPDWRVEHGRVALERFDLDGPGVAYDLAARLQDARARIVSSSGVEVAACDQPRRDGLQCRGRPEWQHVARRWLLVSENADHVVWSHPPSAGERLEITWQNVPIGSAVVLRAGHTRDGADRASAPVRMRVLVDGEEVGVATREPRFDFRTDTFDTSRFQGRAAALTLVVETDDVANQHFAWDAYVVAGGRS